MTFFKDRNDVKNLIDLRAAYQEPLQKLRPYTDALMRGDAPLTAGERELIAAYVSGVNSCRYCYGVHSRVAERFGIDSSLFEQMMADVDNAPINDRLKPILNYAKKLTEEPSKLTQADADAVYQAGWDDQGLFYTVAVCAYFNMLNRIVEGFGFEGSDEFFDLAADSLTSRGYRS